MRVRFLTFFLIFCLASHHIPAYALQETSTTHYIGNLYEEEIDPQSNIHKTKNIYIGNIRVMVIVDDPLGHQVQYIHNDHLGSSNAVTDKDGVLKELIEYEPFGQTSRHQKFNQNKEAAQFTGKKIDDETGLYYFGARYYDSKLGRFITADDIIQNPYNPQTLNRYSYVSNNPVNRFDPTGHSWKKFWQKIFKPLVSFVAAAITVWIAPQFAPMIAQYGFLNVAGTVGVSAAASTATLDTKAGQKFISQFSKGFFDNILGMPPRTAQFFSNMTSHAILASAYYSVASSITMNHSYAGPNYELGGKQNSDLATFKSTGSRQPGGSSVNEIKETIDKGTDLNGTFEYLKEGAAASDVAFKETPGVEQAFKALNIRHSVALVNINGTLKDSAFNIGLMAPQRGAIYASPWTAVCHQATFNMLNATGQSAGNAFVNTLAQAGWSYGLTSSIYGINGGFGVSAIGESTIK